MVKEILRIGQIYNDNVISERWQVKSLPDRQKRHAVWFRYLYNIVECSGDLFSNNKTRRQAARGAGSLIHYKKTCNIALCR